MWNETPPKRMTMMMMNTMAEVAAEEAEAEAAVAVEAIDIRLEG